MIALDNLSTAVLQTDTTGRICWANVSAQTLLQRSLKSLDGMLIHSFFPEDEIFQQAWQKLCCAETDLINIQSDLVFWDISLTRLPVFLTLQSDPSDFSVLIEMRAVDQHLKLKGLEQESKQLEIYHETFRNLAHEVKNPLGGIRGVAQLLEMEFDSPMLREYTQVMIAEVDRLQLLVDRLIQPSQDYLSYTPFNIHEVCEHVCSLISAQYQNQVQILRDYDASIPTISADKNKLIQVILNLMQNAVQSCLSQNTKIPLISLKTRIKHQYYLHGKFYKQVLVFSLIDNGPGVDDSVRDRLFHPLVTTKPEGTGLGLSLAQEYIHRHDGKIDFDSDLEKTEFRVYLPMDL